MAGASKLPVLLNDATSPFGRKVLVAAIERGVVLKERFVKLFEPGPLDAHTPLRQIPALVTAENESVYDSDNILFWIDSKHDRAPLIDPKHRWTALTRISLGNGMMEATLQRVMELRRPAEQQSPSTIERLEDRIWRSIAVIERLAPALPVANPSADTLTFAVALEYASFRFSDAWKERHDALAQWAEELSKRQSMIMTVPTRTEPYAFSTPRA